MIRVTCACGKPVAAHESSAGELAQCACGKVFRVVTAEHPLPDGAGDGDFDARLTVVEGPDDVGTPMPLGGVLDIHLGKLPDKHIQLAQGSRVSRNHAKLARLDFGPSRWALHDLGSTNGTFLNGAKVTEPVELNDGDTISIGDYVLRYSLQKPPHDGPSCPSCGRDLARGAMICTDCGIHIATGKPLVISKGLDEDALAIRADTWIRILSWVIPFGLFPIASEGFGTKKPYAIWTIALVTLVASVSFWAARVATTPDDEDAVNPAGLNMMLWGGSEQVTRDYIVKREADRKERADAAAAAEKRRAAQPPPMPKAIPPAGTFDEGNEDGPDEVADGQAGKSRERPTLSRALRQMRRMQQLEMSAADYEAGARFQPYQLVTHALLHAGIMHIAGNFVFLIVFGLRVNELIGNWKFAVAYPILAVAAAGAHMFTVRHEPLQAMLGASGAIMGLAGMYLVLFPVQKVHMSIWFRGGIFTGWKCFYKVWPMRGFWLLIGWVAFNDILPMLLPFQGEVAHAAHLGGFVAGMFVALFLLIIRQVNARGSDALSVLLGRRAWAIIGKPNQWKDPESVESLASKAVSMNYPG